MSFFSKIIALYFCLFFSLSPSIKAQINLDSVSLIINKSKNDSLKAVAIKSFIDGVEDNSIWPPYNNWLIKICEKNYSSSKKLGNLLGEAYNNKGYILNYLGKTDSALIFYNKCIQVRREIRDSVGIGNVMVNIGFLNQNLGRHDSAIVYYDKGLSYYKSKKNLDGMAVIYNNKASVYQIQGRVKESIASLISAMNIYEKQKNKSGVAWICNSIGYVYQHQDEEERAMEWFNKGLTVAEKENDLPNLALLYNNIASTYQKQQKLKEALKLQLKTIHIRRKLNDVRGMIMSLNNIGSLYTGLKNYSFAEQRLLECRTLCYKINYFDALSQCYSNMTEVYDILGNAKKAKVYADSALLLAKQSNYMEMIYLSSEKSYGIEKKLGNYKNALELLELNVKMGDSIKSQGIRKELYKKQYDYELKQKEELFVEREARKEVELKRQRLIRYLFTGGFVLAVLLALFIFKSLQTNRKKSKIISEQKEKVEIQKGLIEEKQKEIVDSITYAERIQKPLLAKEEIIKHYFSDCFVVFKPKDIVSGDFYWLTEKNDKLFLAVCDSTGHGVPGAFMSLLNIGFLSEAIKEKGILEPSEVFNYVRSRLIESISDDGQKDGFDGALICYDKKASKISYVAAHCTPLVIRNDEIIEMASDKMPVGKGERIDSFTPHQFDVKPGDRIYLYTDGFADQFGGPKGKKFKYRNLKEVLLSEYINKMSKQRDVIDEVFEEWRGNLEQTDDVTIVGLKV